MQGRINHTKDKRGIRALVASIKEDRYAFLFFLLFVALTAAVLLYSLFLRQWHRVFMSALTLALFFIPAFVERKFLVRLPSALEILAYAFIFCSCILGEIAGFYERFSFWDDLLHAFNGYMFAAFGFCLVGLAQRKTGQKECYSPILVVLVAFCFSMTVGAFWELFEYSTDALLFTDMQKDALLKAVHTASLSEAGKGTVHLRDITETVVRTASGEEIVIAGYLDVGLADTMLDLFVNAIGSIVFCVIGYVYLRGVGGNLASQFIPKVLQRNKKG